MQAFRQTLEAGVRWKLIRENPAKLAGPNPQPHRTEIVPFTIDEIDRLALELGPLYGPLVVFAAETGLRPSEWIAIQHADVQRDDGVLVIERSVSRGRLKAYGKTARSRRRVPLSRRALEALDSLPAVSTPASSSLRPEGKHLDLENWRRRDWHPALDSAGIPITPDLRPPAHLRDARTRRRAQHLRGRAIHGDIGARDRLDVRPSGPRKRAAGEAAARRLGVEWAWRRDRHAVGAFEFCAYAGRNVNGSDGTRTRDLRRDRPAF